MRNLGVLAGLCVLGALLASGAPFAAEEASEESPSADHRQADALLALTEGNRLFKNGQVEAAVEAYLAGYSPEAPHPTLFYNLGTAYHHLERLPEAILWYRRAGTSDDPWLEENLWLARRSLGSQILPPGGWLGSVARRAGVLRWSAVAFAWICLAVTVAWRRLPAWGLGFLLLCCGSLYGSAAAVEHWGPRPAVLLADCSTGAGELPAGTEAWVRPLPDGSFEVTGTELACPSEAVGLVFQKESPPAPPFSKGGS